MTTTPILVTYGSKRGGTAEVAHRIAEMLRERGFVVECCAAASVRDVDRYGAVIVGGALYMMRWVREARRFVARHATALRARPVWMFSSGPLDDSANQRELEAVPTVQRLLAHVGARGHVTFGGRLTADATGLFASAMAKKMAGDWRDWTRVDAWAGSIATALAAEPPASGAVAARGTVPGGRHPGGRRRSRIGRRT
jgi:menaquinone-dependent protoporphyrinogen oxidase